MIYVTDPPTVDMSILLLQQGTFPQGMGPEASLGLPGQVMPLPGLPRLSPLPLSPL